MLRVFGMFVLTSFITCHVLVHKFKYVITSIPVGTATVIGVGGRWRIVGRREVER